MCVTWSRDLFFILYHNIMFDWPSISFSLSLFSLAQSLVHSLHAYFLSSRVAVADMLHPLSTSLTVGMETLQHLHTQLSTAAQWNTRTQALLDDAHTLLHTFQVTY